MSVVGLTTEDWLGRGQGGGVTKGRVGCRCVQVEKTCVRRGVAKAGDG